MVFKKYKVADNAMAKLALPLTETTKTISIKDAINIPDGWERIATLVKVAGNEVIKMEKVIVKSRTENVLQVERGFESNPLQRETNDLLCLNVTAEVIRDLQNAVAEIDVNNKESLSNKKAKIVWNQTSNLFYPTVKAVWDWVTGLLSKKADLVNGKVPASQLPEVSQIDESNLVHKSWDEVIEGNKTFSNVFSLSSKTNLTIDKQLKIGTRYQLSNIKHDAGGHITQVIRWDLWSSPEWELSDWGRWLEFWSHKAPFVKMSVDNVEIWHPTKKKQLIVNDQNRTGARDNYTPTRIGWANGIIEARMCKYKKIWKTIFVESFIKFICSSWAAYLDLSAPVQSRNGGRYPLNIHWEQKIARGFNYAGITTILCAFESWVSYDIAFTYIAEIE